VISRRRFLTSVAIGLAPIGAAAHAQEYKAQQPGKVYRIGFLGNSTEALEANLVGPFRDGLRERGYVEGRDLTIEYRWAEGAYERFPALIAELIALKVDVIVTAGTPAALAVKRTTTTIPVVMAAVGDPIGTGLVKSLARPDGNLTGSVAIAPDLEGKRLELLTQIVPKLEGEFDHAFQTIVGQRSGALVMLADRLFLHHRARIVEFTARHRLPAVYAYNELVQVGGLMSFGPSYPEMHRRAAYYVDRILKGAKPGDLPIEQPTKFELVINLKTAHALGLTIPPSLLLRADQVIE
jgi:putative ABC transport system substrate-binding protein